MNKPAKTTPGAMVALKSLTTVLLLMTYAVKPLCGQFVAPDGKGDHVKTIGPASAGQLPISYHGGPVMTAPITVYLIWYGSWANEDTQVLSDFVANIGGSPYFNINTTYHDGTGASVVNRVALGPQTHDFYSRGRRLTDSDIQAIVTAQNPTDINGVYFVLTSADVDEVSGFGSSYCGWHNHAHIGPRDIKFVFVGNPSRFSGCEYQTETSPNRSPAADAMASVIAHELSETVTDPDLNAWYDSSGQENADKCAWTFGPTYRTDNGSLANVRLGARNFLIQQNWVNNGGGYCGLSYQVSSVKNDFNADRHSDVLWTTASGGAAIWLMNGATIIGNMVIQNSAVPGWSIAGVGDFNGDGRSDILWTTASGGVAIWFMDGGSIIGNNVIQSSSVPGWYIARVGDFNGDGHSDILWTTASGGVAIWLMNGATIIGNMVIQNSAVPGWSVAGTGDINGDGRSDILWTTASGGVAIWFMNGGSIIGNNVIQSSSVPGWYVARVGDFNGDGHSDILWTTASGGVAIWLMNGATIIGNVVIQNSAVPGWSIADVGDFNGDGRSDILWTTASGGAAMWFMDGGSIIGNNVIQLSGVPGWFLLSSAFREL